MENIDREQILVRLDPAAHCEFSPEAYLESRRIEINTTFRAIESKTAKLRAEAMATQNTDISMPLNFATFPLSDFVENQSVVEPRKLKDYLPGNIPVITAQASDNGIGG